MTKENEKIIEKRIIEYINLEPKELLETYDDIAELYDNDEISSDDIYVVFEKLKYKMIK